MADITIDEFDYKSLVDRNKVLEAQHNCDVRRTRILRDRPDLPLERTHAYQALSELEVLVVDKAISRYCAQCNSIRSHKICHKCSSPTIVPSKNWDMPRTPRVDLIREAAKELGYAIGVHGTQERDLDLIAMRWVDGALLPESFILKLAIDIGGQVVSTEEKPNGRLAATIQLNGWYKPIDISVM